MMRMTMIVVLVLGLIMAGTAWIAQVRAMARSTTIISGIADLRQENNMEKCQEAESFTSRQLRTIRDSFIPLMWLGGVTAVVGFAGVVALTIKRKDDRGQQRQAD